MDETMDLNVVSIKLPPLLLKAFSINFYQAKCMKCNISCAPVVDDILFHLSVCNGTLIDENIQTVFKFKCLKCNFATDSIDQWKCHLFQLDHISKTFDSDTNRSYNCNLCNTHFYGLQHSILQHQCKPKCISLLSNVMANVYIQHSITDKQIMLYYCSDCLYCSYNLTDLMNIKVHLEEHCKAANTSVCNSCLITFYGSSKEEFLNHKLSFEHMVLWCLNGARSGPKLSTTAFQKLPYYITKYFVISSLLEQFCCIVCNTKNTLTYKCIYDHFKECISSKEISQINSHMYPILNINCNVCGYSVVQGKNLYECWVNHVISFDHLSKTVARKKDKQILYSYYCYVSDSVFYGTDSFIKNLILKTNDDIGRLLFVSDLMTEVYKRVSNEHFSCSILFCCGICQNYTDNQSFDCVHKNDNSSGRLYCSTCLVMFNVDADYTEHLVSSEHIILKYFKPNKLGELTILDHSMKTVKIYFTNLNINDEDDNPHETIYQDNNDMITSIQNITSCDPEENTISNLIEKLSAQSKKSAFNNYLRKNFDLLIQKPEAINDFTGSIVFFCDICNLVVCNHDWIEHDKKFHINNNNLLVLFCDICCIYHVSVYITIEHHLMTIEHIIMEVFQKYLKKNVIKPSVNNINKHNNKLKPPNKGSDFNVEIEKIQNSNVHNKNKIIYIQIKDVDDNLKKNDYCLLNQIIQEKYGEFRQFLNVDNSFMILFENMDQVKCFIEDKNKLKDQHGFTIQIIGEHTEKVLSFDTIDLFKDWHLLCNRISNDLEMMNLTLTSPKIQSRIQKLCDSICNLQIATDSNQIHIFGSRIYGLATNTTDIDIYIETDGTFNGQISKDKDIQEDLINKFAERCLLKPMDFKNVEKICSCRVPIIKFYYVPSKLICDVSFRSGLSVCNTKLIKSYLLMGTTVKWLVCVIVKNWALQNGLKDRHLFTSYSLIWLVLFYLMTEKVVPSLIELRRNATKDDVKIIEGWDCTFGKWSDNIRDVERSKLLLGFFQFYADKEKLRKYVLSTCTGQLIEKHQFYAKFIRLSVKSKLSTTAFKSFSSKVMFDFENSFGLVIQDPFELSFNLTKNIQKKMLRDFCDLCDQSSTLLINMSYT